MKEEIPRFVSGEFTRPVVADEFSTDVHEKEKRNLFACLPNVTLKFERYYSIVAGQEAELRNGGRGGGGEGGGNGEF